MAEIGSPAGSTEDAGGAGPVETADPADGVGTTGMDEPPDITVELAERPSVLGVATLAGAVAGVSLLAVDALGVGTVTAIGYPHVFAGEFTSIEMLFHGLFAVIFGSSFGLLVDARPLWQYGRGFLGPVVGTSFGLVLWAVVTAGFGLFGLVAPGFGLDAVPLDTALGSYLAYGFLLGVAMNGLGLVRA